MLAKDNNIYIGGINILLDRGNALDNVSDLSDKKVDQIRSSAVERIQKLFRDMKIPKQIFLEIGQRVIWYHDYTELPR